LSPGRPFGNVVTMSECGERAILIVTKSLAGTATNVARSRTVLVCGLEAGHGGEHRDLRNSESWDGKLRTLPTIIRHEDEER
jgi:hypothetical protein